MVPGISRCGPVSEPLAVARAAELDLIAIHSGGERLDLFAMASAILGRDRMARTLGGLGEQVKQQWPLFFTAGVGHEAVCMFDELHGVEVPKA